MLNKNKTCLVIMPTDHNQDISTTLKISTVIEIINEFEKEKIDLKIASYRGNKPYLNFEKNKKYNEWAESNEDILLNVLNIDNISPAKFDAILIPNYSYIYHELQIQDHSLCKILLQFHQANKIICTIGHSTYALCKCVEIDYEESNITTWPFVGYNLTGASLNHIMRENLFGSVPHIIEEMVILQGANFLASSEMNDDVIVVI